MVSVGFCQILQEGCDIWTFLPAFFHFPLSPPPHGAYQVTLSSPTLQSKLPTSKLLPKGLWPACAHLSNECPD